MLAGSLLAIAVGYAGGHRFGTTALRPVPRTRVVALPEPIEPRDLPRALHGADSLDAADDDPDPYGDADRAVSARPGGWAPRAFDARHEAARIAVLVVGGDRSATELAPFAGEPFPLAVLVPAQTGTETLRIAREAGMTALVDCAGADPTTIAALRGHGAAGIVCSTDDAARARALIAADRGGIVLDDLLEDDALYRAARAAGDVALTRDVTADARENAPYVDFLLGQALAIAQRTGVAIVAVHARPSSLRALERFAARARRDGARLVSLAGIAAHS
ncbi:MAG TPA: divergent polysaccharide deacetylase family protein [Candidatus Limnocylindria bacterium]|nr:divergent polysaccharide deacetylase family protein [Candidatus Limnocylindria bacterium]